MIKYGDTISSQTTGQPIYGAQVTVLNAQGLQATIYSDEAGTIPLSQPILTDQSGYFSFYIDDGRYNVVVMAGQAEIARTNITMVDTLGIKQRALLVPVNEDGGTIAPADARKGMVLAFDATTGAPSAVLPNEFAGPTGPANSTYTTLASLKAAPQSNRSYILADGTNSPVTYAYVAGDFTGRADDVNVVKLDAVPLTTGALVRQQATSISSAVRPTVEKGLIDIFDRGAGSSGAMEKSLSRAGAVGNGTADDTAACQAAIAEIEYNTRFDQFASNTPYLGPGRLVWPQGLFILTDTLTITRSLQLTAEGNCEYSSGARFQQNGAQRDIFRVVPIAQGASVSISNVGFRANGNGDIANGGSLIRVTSATGRCNTIRIVNCLFASPQKYCVKVDGGDDVVFDRNLYDVSALQGIALGTSASTVSRFLSKGERYFAIAGTCVELYNVRTAQFQNPQVYQAEDAAGNPVAPRTAMFIDAYQTLPTRLHGIGVYNGNFQAVNRLVAAGAGGPTDGVMRDFHFVNNTGRFLGQGDAGYSAIELYGQVTGCNISGNVLTGSYGSRHFIDASGAAVSGAVFEDNSFTNTGGAGAPQRLTTIAGRIGLAAATGFANNAVGHRFATTGGFFGPGQLNAGQEVGINVPVLGALQQDTVDFTPTGLAWPLPDGVTFSRKPMVTAPGVATIYIKNTTAASVGVTAFDLAVSVTR